VDLQKCQQIRKIGVKIRPAEGIFIQCLLEEQAHLAETDIDINCKYRQEGTVQ
jgi:hypothetical protein